MKKSHILLSVIFANIVIAYSRIKKVGLREIQNYTALKCWAYRTLTTATRNVGVPRYTVMTPEKNWRIKPL